MVSVKKPLLHPALRDSEVMDRFGILLTADLTPQEYLSGSRGLYEKFHDREHPDIDKFLFDRENFLGLEQSEVRPNVLKAMRLITQAPEVNVVKMLVGSGGGKSYLVSLLLAYKTDDFVSYINPQRYFGLATGTSVAIINLSVNAGQALNIIFKNSKNWIGRIRSFQNIEKKLRIRRAEIEEKYREFNFGTDPNIVPEPYREARAEIEFPEKNLIFISGHSKAASFYGYSVFAGTIDEADHIERATRAKRKTVVEEETTYTEELFGGIRKAIFSRFKSKGLLFLVSTPIAKTAFLTSRVYRDRDEAQEISIDDGHIIVEGETLPKERPECYYRKSPESAVPGYELSIIAPTWVMTGERREKYIKSESDVKALRDFGCQPPDAASGAMPDPEIIPQRANHDRENPWDERNNVIDFSKMALDPRATYYYHGDLALTGDNVGHCLGHYSHNTGRYTIDFYGNVFTSHQKPFNLDMPINILLSLQQRGYRIGMATFDGFASEHIIQKLSAMGIPAGHLSADKTKGPYDTLINLHLQDLMDYPPHPQYDKEMRYLEVGDKYEHPSQNPDGTKGSKDIADSASCVMYQCATTMVGLLIGSDEMRAATDGVRDVNARIMIGDEAHSICRVTEDFRFEWVFKDKMAPLHNRSAYLDTIGDDVLLVIGYKQVTTFIVDFLDIFSSADDAMVPTVMANIKGMKCLFVASAPTAPWGVIDALRKSGIRHVSANMDVSEKHRQKHVRPVRAITYAHISVMIQAIKGGTLKICNNPDLVRDLYEITESNYDTKHYAQGLAGWLHYNLQDHRNLAHTPMPHSMLVSPNTGGSGGGNAPSTVPGEKKMPKSVWVHR